MNGDIVIRSAWESDFPPLCNLYCKSVKCNPAGFIQDLKYHGCLITKTREWRARHGEMLVAVEGKRVIAMGALAPEDDTHVELCKLHVDEIRQGHGIGRMMTQRLIALARERGFSDVVLHVTTTQKAAINLYRSLGFRPVRQALFETTVFSKAVAFDTLYMHKPIAGSEAQAAIA